MPAFYSRLTQREPLNRLAGRGLGRHGDQQSHRAGKQQETSMSRTEERPLAPPMPQPSFATVNGIRMAYYEAGPRQGVPVVLCHGFPEFSYSWRHQIAALAAANVLIVREPDAPAAKAGDVVSVLPIDF